MESCCLWLLHTDPANWTSAAIRSKNISPRTYHLKSGETSMSGVSVRSLRVAPDDTRRGQQASRMSTWPVCFLHWHPLHLTRKENDDEKMSFLPYFVVVNSAFSLHSLGQDNQTCENITLFFFFNSCPRRRVRGREFDQVTWGRIVEESNVEHHSISWRIRCY